MNIYVSNIAFNATTDDLRQLFESYGAVDKVNIITDRDTGQSRGFGFVEMASEDEATGAIAQFNGQEYDGRNMVVNEARPREERPSRASRRTPPGPAPNRAGAVRRLPRRRSGRARPGPGARPRRRGRAAADPEAA